MSEQPSEQSNKAADRRAAVEGRQGIGPDTKLARHRVARTSEGEDGATYAPAQLRTASIFGVGPEVIAGALRLGNVKEDDALTVSQVEDLIDAFLNREVED